MVNDNIETAELNQIKINPAELEVKPHDESLYFTIESAANEEITVELEFFPMSLKSYLYLTTSIEKRFTGSQNNSPLEYTPKETKSYLLNLEPKSKKSIFINIKRKNNTSRYNLYGIIDRFFINSPKLEVNVLKGKGKRFVGMVSFIIPEKGKRPRNVDPMQSTKNVINNNRTSSVVKNETPSSASVDNPLKPIDSKKPSGLEKDNYEFKKDIIDNGKVTNRINTSNYTVRPIDTDLNDKLILKKITSSIDPIDSSDTTLRPSEFDEANSEVKDDTNIGKGKAKEKADYSNNLVRFSDVSSPNLKVIITYCQSEFFIKERLENRLINKLENNRNPSQGEVCIEKSNDWYQKFQKHIAGANALILIISEAFFYSKFILDENVKKLLTKRKNEELFILPLVSHSLWSNEKLWTELGIEVSSNKVKVFIGHGWDLLDEQLDEVVNKIMVRFPLAKIPSYEEDITPTETDKESKESKEIEEIEKIEKRIPPEVQHYKHDEENPPLAEEKIEELKKLLNNLKAISNGIGKALPSISGEGKSDSIPSANLIYTLQGIPQYFKSLKSDKRISPLISNENTIRKPLESDNEQPREPLESDNERIRRDLIFTVFGPFFCSSAEVLKEKELNFDELSNLLKDIHINLESIHDDISKFLKDYYNLKPMEIILGVSRYNEYEHEIAGYAKALENYKPRTIISVQRWGYKTLENKIVEKAIVLLNA